MIGPHSGRREQLPRKPARPCNYPNCSRLTHSSYCSLHAKTQRPKDTRSSSAARGYGNRWRKIRERVLAAHGIPRSQWPQYDVDHRPPYNPEVEPDHNRYQLTPMLRSEHSRKTAKHDIARDDHGVFRGREGASQSSRARQPDRGDQGSSVRTSSEVRG